MSENIFGTDGIRTRLGDPPFTHEQLFRLGHVLGRWACERYGQQPQIVLGHDTRESCSFVKSALQSGILLNPVTIYDAHIAPTPTLCQLTRVGNQFDCAIVISASHNPYHDNGIKIIDRSTGKLSHEDERYITSLFYQPVQAHTYTTFGNMQTLHDALRYYVDHLQTFFNPNFLCGKKIVLDCAHGATYRLAPEIFTLFGATVITINNQPNGTNINHGCGALHLESLQDAVIDNKADAGFAFDGDGDRVMAVNHDGVIKNGDDILALLLDHPIYRSTRAIVGTIMTNQGFAELVRTRNIQLLRTPVGDKYITEKLIHENLLIGGEQSGHIILRDYLDTGDGIFTALRVMEAILETHNTAMITFEKYPQIIMNIPVAIKKDLNSPVLAAIIAQGNEQLVAGRMVVRYSGTENLLRIMIEDMHLSNAHYVGTLVCQALSKELSTI